MKNEMRLQGIGLVEGTEAGKIQVGDILRWNFGSLSRVVAIDFTKTGKTIIVTTEYFNEITGEMVQAERKMRVTRLVSIVASGNTKLISKYNYEMVEEVLAPEEAEALKAEVEEIIEAFEEKIVVKQIEESTDLKKSIHEIAYRVTNHGSYVEVMLFVTDIANDVTLVAQQEGEFNSMAEAEALISYLKKTGNKIEFVETMAYTG